MHRPKKYINMLGKTFVFIGLICWASLSFLWFTATTTTTTTQPTLRTQAKTKIITTTTTTTATKTTNHNQQPLINSCDDVVIQLQDVPPGNNPYPFLQDLQVIGGSLIVPGHPINQQSVSENDYVYFQACIPDESQHHHFHNIQITVKAISGDPDLFVSVTHPHPTLVDSTWLSKRIGGESITLPSNHPDFPSGTRTLYFGVGSHKSISTFSVSIDILDRKNKYQGLRLRKDDVEMQKEKAHETWKAGVRI